MVPVFTAVGWARQALPLWSAAAWPVQPGQSWSQREGWGESRDVCGGLPDRGGGKKEYCL